MKKLKIKGELPKPRNPLVEVVMKLKSSKHEKTNKSLRRQEKVAFLKSIYGRILNKSLIVNTFLCCKNRGY